MTIKLNSTPRQKKHLAIRAKIRGTSRRPRLSVFRSHGHIYLQLIDDEKGKTLFSLSDLNLKEKGSDKKKVAKEVGKKLGQGAVAKNIKEVVFDRGSFIYHGRIKAAAEGAREGGLLF